jgi:hypothetical protein
LICRYGRRVLDDLKKAVPDTPPSVPTTARGAAAANDGKVPSLSLSSIQRGASPAKGPGACPTARSLPAPSARFHIAPDSDLPSLLAARDLTFRPLHVAAPPTQRTARGDRDSSIPTARGGACALACTRTPPRSRGSSEPQANLPRTPSALALDGGTCRAAASIPRLNAGTPNSASSCACGGGCKQHRG